MRILCAHVYMYSLRELDACVFSLARHAHSQRIREANSAATVVSTVCVQHVACDRGKKRRFTHAQRHIRIHTGSSDSSSVTRTYTVDVWRDLFAANANETSKSALKFQWWSGHGPRSTPKSSEWTNEMPSIFDRVAPSFPAFRRKNYVFIPIWPILPILPIAPICMGKRIGLKISM